jgi:hypothetical protein
LVQTNPEPYVDGAAELFRQYFMPLIKRKKHLDWLHPGKVDDEMALTQSPDYSLDVRKLNDSLVRELKRSGIARLEDDSVVTERWVGGVYMLCLAIEMSRRIGTPPATHITTLASLGEYLTFGKPLQSGIGESTTTLLHLGIRLPKPQALANVSLKKVIAFHEKYSDERRRFRRTVEAIREKVSVINDPNALTDYLAAEEAEIRQAIGDHRKTLKDLKIRSFGSLMRISAPTFLGAAAASVAFPHQIVSFLTGIGIGLSLEAWWAERRIAKSEEIRKTPYHYLLTLKKEFPHQEVMPI